jgi:hypothetical protein
MRASSPAATRYAPDLVVKRIEADSRALGLHSRRASQTP